MSDQTVETVDFNTFSPEIVSDPYPAYAQLREFGRVLWFPAFGTGARKEPEPETPGAWIVSHYDDCMSLLRDDRVSSDPMKSGLFKVLVTTLLGGEDQPAIDLMRHLLLFMDPPDHTRLRTLANAAFSRKAVEEWRPRITELVDDMLAENRELDLVADFAYPLPITVIAELLGVPMSDRDTFTRWARELIDLFGNENVSPQSIESGNEAILAMNDYFTELANDRRRTPRDDLLTAFVEVEDEGERLTHEELLATCLLLLLAGHETTANLIGLGSLALLRNPEVLGSLRDQPALVPSAVDELLRYDSPVQFTARTTLAPIEIDGREIPTAERVLVLLAAANHDPAKFKDPDRIVPERSPNPHLSFGGGIHFCLGAPLARLEARIAFAKLVQMPLELVSDELEWRATFPIRGLRSLHVRI